MFEAQVYEGRRRALATALAAGGTRGVVLFAGNGEAPMNYPDNCYRFRQDSSFLYFFGIAEPGLWATLDLDGGVSTLYVDELSEAALVWTGPRPSPAELAAASAAERYAPAASVADTVRAALASSRPVHYLPPYRAETALELSRLLGVDHAAVGPGASMALIRAVVALRELKEPREIAEIEKAVDISIGMHEAVVAAARPGMGEAELMAIAYGRALAGGGMPSFPPIATVRGDVLHNHGYAGVLREGACFLLDCGAETAEGYAGDLTSSFPVGRRFDSRQAAAYELVLAAGRAASAVMKPGVPFLEAHLAASKTLAAGLRSLGLLKGEVDEAVAAGAHALFFPHGLGHQMGLDVHDMESLGEDNVGYGEGYERSALFGYRSLRMAKPLKAGMVMTVEPGLYFIEGLIAAWKRAGRHEALINYAEAERWVGTGGFRNEEDWLVVEGGARRLGREFDKSLAAMEARRAAALG